MGRLGRLGILGALYVVQGIVFGFGGLVLVPTLAAADVSLGLQTGILALAGVPWVLKLLWAPLLDLIGGKGSGRARAFAAAAMVAMAGTLAGLASLTNLVESLSAVAWLWLALNVALSLQDVATDALVIDLVPAQQRGVANGVLLGGHHLGAEGIGSMGLGLLVVSYGVSTALWAQAGIMLALAALPLLLPRTGSSTPPGDAAPGSGGSELGAALRALVASPRALKIAVLAAVIMSADVITFGVSAQFWTQRLNWTIEDLTQTLAPVLLVASLLAYGVATVAVDRLGHGRSAAAGTVALGTLWVAFGLVPSWWSSSGFVLGFVVAQALATAPFRVGLHAALMDVTSPALRASHFAVLMALLNLPRVAVIPWSDELLAAVGFSGLFVAAGVFQIAMAGGLRLCGLVGPGRAAAR